jgi:hypothetical protein
MEKNVFTLLFPPLSPTRLRLRCSNFFNPSKKNSFGCAANRKIGKAKDLSAPLRNFNLFYINPLNQSGNYMCFV